jgi:hypothetical protein
MGYHSMNDETTRASIASKLAKEREQVLAQRSALTNALIAPCISATSTASKAVTSDADRPAAKRDREERRHAETARPYVERFCEFFCCYDRTQHISLLFGGAETGRFSPCEKRGFGSCFLANFSIGNFPICSTVQ